MWLGRVLGQVASHASILSAYGDAKKSLAAMQAAVQLNPQNGPALSDLGDYYAQAPGIAGGGTDKAQQVASQLDKVDAGRAAQLRGDIAMQQKNYTEAEQDYKQSASVSTEARRRVERAGELLSRPAASGPSWMPRSRAASPRPRKTRARASVCTTAPAC